MSNENPTMEELYEVVALINFELGDIIYDKGYEFSNLEGMNFIELRSNGSVSVINAFGNFIWGSEDDPRKYLEDDDEDYNITIVSNSEEAREGLHEYLITQIELIYGVLGTFISYQGEK